MNTHEETTWHEELSKVVHQWVNPSTKFDIYAKIEDAGDGSGDAILTFPEGFCETVGWKVGDTLDLYISGTGGLTISKKY